MTPKDFLIEVVNPNVAAFHGDFASLRRAFNAVASVDDLFEEGRFPGRHGAF